MKEESRSESREELRSRRISTEDMIRETLVDLTRIRADLSNPHRVQVWSETLEAFADLLQPWADEDSLFLGEWQQRPMRVYRIRDPNNPDADRLVPWPTARDCRAAQQIIMGLLSRAGILVKRRTVSGPKRPEKAQEGQNRPQEPRGEPDPMLGAM